MLEICRTELYGHNPPSNPHSSTSAAKQTVVVHINEFPYFIEQYQQSILSKATRGTDEIAPPNKRNGRTIQLNAHICAHILHRSHTIRLQARFPVYIFN